MIMDAPDWSPVSLNFAHGFPRRMVQAEHGGFRPGNIIVTSKATNLALRRMAVCDVASLTSRASIAGSGLATGRLVNLRYVRIYSQWKRPFREHPRDEGMFR